MKDRLKMMETRYEEINKLLSDPEVCTDIKRNTNHPAHHSSMDTTFLFPLLHAVQIGW